MNRPQRPAVRAIVSFIGIDYALLKRSGEDNIVKFYVSGFFVAAIFFISFFAVFYAFELMFHKWYAELLLSAFFSFTFLIIYLLLIQTFSKETLPSSYRTTFFNTSNITRICFVLLISFLIAQPVKIFLLRDQLEADVAGYKADLYQEFSANVSKLYQRDLDKLYQRKMAYQNLADQQYNADNDLQIQAIQSRMERDKENAYRKIVNADFFLKRVEFAGKYPSSWWTCLVVIIVFAFPVFLIYSISDQSRYYSIKRVHDHDLVLNEYLDFKQTYRNLFWERYRMDIQFPEYYADAPFNRIRITGPQRGNQKDFLTDLHHHGL